MAQKSNMVLLAVGLLNKLFYCKNRALIINKYVYNLFNF